MIIEIDLTEGGWFDGLLPLQSETIESLIAGGKSEEEVAEIWLSTSGSITTFGFGTSPEPNNFYKNVKEEFFALICGAKRYNKERKELKGIWEKGGKISLVTATAVVISQALGLSAVVIIPVVALLFSATSKITLNAICRTYHSESAPD